MKNVFKLLFVFFTISFLFIFDVRAENVSCTYVLEKGSCNSEIDGEISTGKTFTAVINIDGADVNLTIDSSTVNYINNNYAATGLINLKNGENKYVSAVDYYKEYETCPPYFAIADTGVSGIYDGYFVNEKNSVNESYSSCIFPIKQIEYNEELEREEEIYSCTLYSSDPLYLDKSINVQINYTNKTISIDGAVVEAIEEYEKNFNFKDKNKCPVDQLKVCVLNDIVWTYPKDYEDTYVKMCGILDSSKKLEVGDSYCGVFKKYSVNAKDEKKLKNFCNMVLQNDNYNEDKYSCINMCLKIDEYVDYSDEITDSNGQCGLSERLISWILNIMRWIKYIIPVAVIVLGILDFIKAIGADKDDEMKKAQGRFMKRLIAAALIFLVPLIIEFVLSKIGFEKYIEGCGIIDL